MKCVQQCIDISQVLVTGFDVNDRNVHVVPYSKLRRSIHIIIEWRHIHMRNKNFWRFQTCY